MDSAEIGLANVKIRLLRNEDSSISLQAEGIGRSSIVQVGVSLDGRRLEFWPVQGVNMNPTPEAPMVPVFLVSDKEAFFGRTCPKCQGYFRTTKIAKVMHCPYCSIRANLIRFTTKNQLQFIDEVRKRFLAGFSGDEVKEIDLDAIAKVLPNNRPTWAYSEQRRQNSFTCEKCENRYDILGEYGCCPKCGARNSLQVVTKYLDRLFAQFESADANIADRSDRQIEWEKMTTRSISDFEAMARDIQKELIEVPMTPTRRNEVKQISFQQILKARESLRGFFAIDLFESIGEDEQAFLNKMFNRRHVLTHNGGRVDQEYLDRSGDSSVELYEKIVVRSREIYRLIPLLKTIATNLFEGYESIEM
jgi:Zn finger protein HypA/HybF involved in hydrogenase expression